MKHFDTRCIAYRKAFDAYLRRGIPIEVSLKSAEQQKRTTTHYIWRTRQDGKVRSSHAINHGKIFAWDNPSSSGHPGEDYGCRCIAEPYTPQINETFEIDFRFVSDSSYKWTSEDFVFHYFFGRGKPVKLRETGHLKAVINRYKQIVIDDPKRLPGQIAKLARLNLNGVFGNDFHRPYDMQDVVFSLGSTTIGGHYSALCKEKNGVLTVQGRIDFYHHDMFEDVTGIARAAENDILDFGENFGELPLSNRYEISDEWVASFSAEFLYDKNKSKFVSE